MDKLIFEQDGIKFFENEITKLVSEGRYLVLLALSEDLKSEYVLYFDGNPIYSSQSIESIAAHMDMRRISNDFNN